MAPVFETAPIPVEGVSRDAVAVKAVTRVLSAWNVNASASSALLGVSDRTWSRMRAGNWSGTLSQDQLQRASGLIGIYKGLHLYFGDELADKWISMQNKGPLFKDGVPISFMIEGGLPSILDTREYIDSIRGGL
jgi:uncharacterized protein (DUF2384 family)